MNHCGQVMAVAEYVYSHYSRATQKIRRALTSS
jgi:hypothetical protein